MNRERALHLMKIEKECIERAEECDRECGKCDLVQDTEELLAAYDFVIGALEKEDV